MKIIAYILVVYLGFLSGLPIIDFSILCGNGSGIQCKAVLSDKIERQANVEDKINCCQGCMTVPIKPEGKQSHGESNQNTNKNNRNHDKPCNPFENCDNLSCITIITPKLLMDKQIEKISFSNLLSVGQILYPKYSFWHPPNIS